MSSSGIMGVSRSGPQRINIFSLMLASFLRRFSPEEHGKHDDAGASGSAVADREDG
jgi:hypothetical protein